MVNQRTLREKAVEIVRARDLVKWLFVVLLGLGAISALFQGKFVAALAVGFLAYVWTPHFDEWTIRGRGKKYSGWMKFWITWGLLAILTFGGFYR